MPTPISGDKIFTHQDAKPSQTTVQDRKASSGEDVTAKAPQQDSVQLSGVNQSESVRPLSDSIRSTEQAQNRLQALLKSLQDAPEKALTAHGNSQQGRAETLLHPPA